MLQETPKVKDNLTLSSLEINNFRPFEHLEIPSLGRVNLIVGKNSVGKSSVLEGLWLYANQGSPVVIRTLLTRRNEFASLVGNSRPDDEIENWLSSIKHLFYGRESLGLEQPTPAISISAIGAKQKSLTIRFSWFIEQMNEEGSPKLQSIDLESNVTNEARPGIFITFGTQPSKIFLFDRSISLARFVPEKPISYIRTNGLSDSEIKNLWNFITLTDAEDDILKAVKIISPDIEKLNVISTNRSERLSERLAEVIVRVKGSKNPIPLRSLGDGVNRVFGIALALVNSKDNFLLVDEIENGLHYSVQLNLWRIIFELSQRLNVQVFATTHSNECIYAFQQAAVEAEQAEGLLIRIENKKGKIISTLFDEEQLTIATQEDIEVR